ncbi:hypothetical protein [Deinococcus marmoris]|uniref:hypothetical protein n=1 Tax=Deinococcus marmoris TaxID=249408 RepID=UPI000495F9E1|nr:hypothetical protein [Deinococcus marmoris]
MIRTYEGSTPSRKGTVLLRRFNITLPFESTIEECALRLWDIDPFITSITRAEGVDYHLPDGSKHIYTPDFTLTLADGRLLSVDCKPAGIVGAMIANAALIWQIKAERLAGLGQPLYIFRDSDYSPARLQQAQMFGRYCGYDIDPHVRQDIVTLLRECGAMQMSAVRDFALRLAKGNEAQVDASLKGMLAAQELVAEAEVKPLACRIDLPGNSLAPQHSVLGVPMLALLQNPPPVMPEPSTKQQPTHLHREEKFKQSARGTRLLHLFVLYNDPSQPLEEADVERLTAATGVSRPSLFRFRAALQAAGAPGITFSEVAAVLLGETKGRPRRQLDAQVAAIMEQLTRQHYFIPLDRKEGVRARSVADLYAWIARACQDEELPVPGYNTVKRFLQRWTDRDPVQAALLRDGRDAAHKLEARQGRLDLLCCGELLTVDCTPADLFTCEDGSLDIVTRAKRGKGQRRKGARRANIVTVVDAVTSEVVRSVVFAEAISAASILLVLRDVFLGEQQELNQAGVTMLPVGAGLPERLRIDSGSEFVNRQVSRALTHLGIDVLQRNKPSRHHGGIEERTIGTLTHQQHLLPGTSMNTIVKRGEYDAQAGAILSLEDLIKFNHRIVERHNQLCAPLQMLTRHEHAADLVRRGLGAWSPLSAVQEDYLRHRMRPQEVRRCQHEGISLHDLMYVAAVPAELSPLIVRRANVDVVFDADDISVAQAIHPDTGKLIDLVARVPRELEGQPLSLKVWSAYKRRLRASRQVAEQRAPTNQQIAAQVLAERPQRPAGRGKPGTVKTDVDVPKPSPSPKQSSSTLPALKAAKIEFEFNPPTPHMEA